jgi:hypothetical protein
MCQIDQAIVIIVFNYALESCVRAVLSSRGADNRKLRQSHFTT